MEVRIRHAEGKQSEAFARFHRLVSDQPFADGGSDYGMTPPELMLSAIGCSVMHSAREYLRSRYLAVNNIEVRVAGRTTGQPALLADIEIAIDAPGLNPTRREGLLRAVQGSTLYQSLIHPPHVEMALTSLEPVDLVI